MKTRRTLLACLLVFALPAAAWAQAGFGVIVGTITDPSGGVVPHAKVKVVSEGTGLIREVESNTQGYFVIPSLRPATYVLAVQSPGFVEFEQKAITLQADQSVTVNVLLALQRTQQQIVVEEAASLVNTQTSTLSQVVDTKRIIDLPLNGRNAATLTLLVPGLVQAPGNNSDQGVYKTFPVAVTISANGSRNNQTSFNMDGANNNDTYTNVNQPFPFPDALQEFSVQTSNYSARYGGNSGAVVNIVTKSGTNDVHGDVFEFVRNAEFNARNFFASSRDRLKRNQFGGTVGGPVVIPRLYNGKAKTFFFAGYQGTRLRNTSNALSTYVPTIDNERGDFSNVLSASNPNNPFGRAMQITDPLNGQPFANNIIPSSRFDPAAVAFFKYLPQVGGNGRVFYTQPTRQDFNEVLARGDHSFNENDRLTARYFIDRFTNTAFLDPSNYVNVLSGSRISSHNALINETHIFRPNLINDFRLGFSRVQSYGGPPPNTISLADLGVSVYQPAAPTPKSLDGISVSGYFSLSDFPWALMARTNYTLDNDVSWVRGRHNFSFGGSYIRGFVMLRDGYRAYGGYTFATNYTNNAAASFMLGKVRTFAQGDGEFKDNRGNYVSLYAQDDFHATSRLTLNYGLRWEPFIPWQEIRGRVEQWRLENYQQGIRSQVFTNAPPGLLFPGDSGMPDNGVTGNAKHFSPRVGFAYDVFGDGKTSIRGGSGIFYDSQQVGIINNRFVNVSPFSQQISLTDPVGTFSNPYLGVVNPFPSTFPPAKNAIFPAPVLVITYDPRNNSQMAVPVTYNWNLAVERQVSTAWLLRVAYVGSHSNHQTETIELNPAVYIPGSSLSTDSRRLFQPYASIGQASQDINSSYNSLQLTAQHRFARGMTILMNYTFSKSLDDVPFGQGNAGVASQNDSTIPWYMPGRHQMDYGLSDFNRAHRFVVSYSWDLPKLNATNAALRYALGDWRASGILTYQTGAPLTVTAGTDLSQTGLGSDRAVLLNAANVGAGACGSSAPCANYLIPSAFGLPATGTFGNVGKGSIIGPNLINWDMGVFKEFPVVRERVRAQLRAEFFNTANRVNFNNPTTNRSSAAFGTISAAGDPRIGQWSLKWMF
jgi:hypothetical protein